MWRQWLGGGVLLAALAVDAGPVHLLDAERALLMSGEVTPNGSVSVSLVPAPGGAPGVHTLRLCFRLDRHVAGDWIDASWHPSPPLDLSAAAALRLPMLAEREMPFLTLKLVDPDNPGVNQSAFEGALSHQGGPLPAGRWVDVDVPLPEDARRRDGLTYVGFYVAAADQRVPLGEDIVVHVGQFPLVLPPRPPWPPERPAEGLDGWRPVWSGPLRPGPWTAVRGRDNQATGVAEFVDGAVAFAADAAGWNEFLWSDSEALPIRPLTTYRLQFDYQVDAAPHGGPEATFYSLVRARGTIQEDVGWQRWQGLAGSRGRRMATFTTRDTPGIYLIFGVRHQGAIVIRNVQLWEAGAPAGGMP